MVVLVKTDLKPSGLLGRILMTEAHIGRLREAKRYSSRIIDIDILLYNKQIIKMADLVIPHPSMHERRFILVPLCENAQRIAYPLQGSIHIVIFRGCYPIYSYALHKQAK